MPRLQDKTALVTGGARGIGAAIARSFRKEGANVVLTAIDAELGRKTAGELGATFFKLDVASETDWNAVAAEFPTIDVLVNNAGITGFENLTDPIDKDSIPLFTSTKATTKPTNCIAKTSCWKNRSPTTF